ncbi:MAG TPA: hypothetical protein VGJ31_17395 [Dongiaceae bacterium]
MRQLGEIVLPLILPTLIYFGYVLYARARGAQETPDMPWVWLGAAGGLLLGVTFLALALLGGASPSEVYQPAKVVNGTVQPGEFKPGGSGPSGNVPSANGSGN